MAAYFLDSSAIVKRYISEVGSAWIMDLMDPARANRIYAAGIAGAEVVAAMARRAAQAGAPRPTLLGAIADFRIDFSRRFVIVDVSFTLIAAAMDIAERHALRGYDCVQLAAAVQVNREYLALASSCTLVSADGELNAAALASGLVAENPNAHP
jgi:predicted nucleic acid-binding protein